MELRVKRHLILSIIFVQCSNIAVTQSANILFYYGVSGYSHRITTWSLVEKLADLGHSVTFLSPYHPKVPSSHPNITDYVPENLIHDTGILELDFITVRLNRGVAGTDSLWEHYHVMGENHCKGLMNKPQFINWVENSKFDLMIVSTLFNECAYGLVHKFKAKLIAYVPSSQQPWVLDGFGLPDENYPEVTRHPSVKMSFLESVRNELIPLYWLWKRNTVTFPRIEELLKKGLNIPDLPSLADIERNASMLFLYTHFSEEFPRSFPPNVVEIGGIHCNDDRKPLPDDLEEFINSNDDGFILLSFGTYVALSNLPERIQKVFFNTIDKVPNINFLVKYSNVTPSYFPKNAKAVQWIPQQDVVAHPKMRALIGHAGLLGTQEAIYHGVPMIVMPLFAEQDYNAVRAHTRETAIALELSELTEEKLLNAILEVINNKKYKENTMKISNFFRDRPRRPLDDAVWWIEFVLRNDDFSLIRPVGINRRWYERRLLHIWGFLVLVLCIFCVLVMVCTAGCYAMITRRRLSFGTKQKVL